MNKILLPSLESLLKIEMNFNVKFPLSYIDYLKSADTCFNFDFLYPKGFFIDSIENFQLAIKDLPKDLLPFFFNPQPQHIDYYCFDQSTPGPEYGVVAFTDVIVFQWKNFNAWIRWN